MDSQENQFDEWGLKRHVSKPRISRVKPSVKSKKSRCEDWDLSTPESNPAEKRSVLWAVFVGIFMLILNIVGFLAEIMVVLSGAPGDEEEKKHSSPIDFNSSTSDADINHAFNDTNPYLTSPTTRFPTIYTESNPLFQEQRAFLDNDIDFFKNN